MSESPQGLRLKFQSRPYSGHPNGSCTQEHFHYIVVYIQS